MVIRKGRAWPIDHGRVRRLLHWIAAALVLWQFAIVIAYRATGGTPGLDRIASSGPSHGSVGLFVLALTVPRMVLAIGGVRRGGIAGAMHAAMYAVMLAIPVLGLMRAYGSGKGWVHWGIQIVPVTGAETPWMIAAADALHGELAWALLVMIAGHVSMAALHRLSRDTREAPAP